MPLKKLVIATRGSRLALWQAEHVRDLLRHEHGISATLLVLKTRGDIILDVPLSKVGGKGLFVKEIEEALLRGDADIAVHSMKDLPMELPQGLVLGAVPKRGPHEDVLLSEKFESLEALPPGARVGTSSLRRQAQILALRPDLTVLSLRGNVDTRLRKLVQGEFDAIIMAAAGLHRLGLRAGYMIPLALPRFLPACGQGALGIEFHESRQDLHTAFAFLNHEPTRACIEAERGFLAGLEGGCQVPIAAHAVFNDETEQADAGLLLEGMVADVSGRTVIRRTIRGAATNARKIGLALAETIREEGGGDILDELYRKARQENAFAAPLPYTTP